MGYCQTKGHTWQNCLFFQSLIQKNKRKYIIGVRIFKKFLTNAQKPRLNVNHLSQACVIGGGINGIDS